MRRQTVGLAVTAVVAAGTVAFHRPSVPVMADTLGHAGVQVIVTAAPVIGWPVTPRLARSVYVEAGP